MGFVGPIFLHHLPERTAMGGVRNLYQLPGISFVGATKPQGTRRNQFQFQACHEGDH
jgi:hypothetical protein